MYIIFSSTRIPFHDLVQVPVLLCALILTEASLCTCQPVNQCVGGSTQKLLSKSRLFTCPDDRNTLMVAAGDESSSSVSTIWLPLSRKILEVLIFFFAESSFSSFLYPQLGSKSETYTVAACFKEKFF